MRRVQSIGENLAGETLQAAWQALADAAANLARIASAFVGKNLSSPPHPLPISLSPPCPTVAEACSALLKSKAALLRSDSYLEQLRIAFAEFSAARGKRLLSSITVEELELWAGKFEGAPRTLKGRIQYLRLLFGWAMRRGWISANPAAALDLPTLDNEPPGIHTPAQVRALLEAARKQEPGLAKTLAIRYFAGLRTAELARLGPENIRERFIEIPAAKAKTRQRRLVTIHPTLKEWLALSPWMPGDQEKRLARVCAAAGISWPHNVTRHSFVSYHLAMFQNAGKTALEAGHAEAMLFAHYREMVTPEAAAEFWAIVPGSGNKVTGAGNGGSG